MSDGPPAAGTRALRRRPPCRNFGGDERSKLLAQQMVERSRQISALHREQLADVAEFDRAEGWRGDGAVSMITWVTAQCGVSTSTARQWVRAAANLESLPCLAEGLALGELSLDKVEPLAEVASVETDAALREASFHWSVRQARQLATWHLAQREEEERAAAHAAAQEASPAQGGEGVEAGVEAGAEAGVEAGVEAAAREFERRTLRFNDVRRSIWVAFTKDDYAVAKSALVGRVSAEIRERKWAGPAGSEASGSEAAEHVSFDQRLYDALQELFAIGSAPTAGRRRAFRPRVIVHAPLDVLIGTRSQAGVAEIAGVGPVPAEVARRLACDAEVVLSVEGRDGSILDQGRVRREPTTAQRVEIDRRDKGCRFPGCTYNEFTDVHHVRHWTRGGDTNLDNLVTLCGRHHNAVHELGWHLAGDANGQLTFMSPHGRAMTSVPSPTWPRAMLRKWTDRSPPDPPLRR